MEEVVDEVAALDDTVGQSQSVDSGTFHMVSRSVIVST